MDWSLVLVGGFATVAIVLLFDARRDPNRWRATNVERWRHASLWTVALTAAAMVGAALADAGLDTLGYIAVVGAIVFAMTSRLWSIAASNNRLDR
jgi:hypothetical protein